MKVPARWRDYPCEDYFASPLARTGWFDEGGQYWYIEPAERVVEDRELGLLILGGPGVDLIRWGYRKGEEGVWAHYPMEREWRRLALSAQELREGYASGRIKV